MKNPKLINLALQGGGAHGAFAWGVMDKIIEDGRLMIDGLGATSAGAMNAAVYAYGKMTGGPDGAREALHNFWYNISRAGERYSPLFTNREVTLDVVLASACLPFLFQAVEIDGAAYWDGGYMGNPALFPLFYHTDSRDIVILHINPIFVHEVPKTASEITDRINQISFNGSLIKELRSIAFVTKLLEEGWLKNEYRSKLRHMLVHSIRADEALKDEGVASKFNCDWNFLTDLRDRGRATAEQWLAENYIHIGKRGTVDLREEFLGGSSQHADTYPLKGGTDHAQAA